MSDRKTGPGHNSSGLNYDFENLPWDEQAERRCGQFSRRFAERIDPVAPNTDNVTPNGIQFTGIVLIRGEGLGTDLDKVDFTEYFKAWAEYENYYSGENPPVFWDQMSPEQQQSSLAGVVTSAQKYADRDPVVSQALAELKQAAMIPSEV